MGSDRSTALSEEHAALRASTALALRNAVVSNKRAWNDVERVVRDYARAVRALGVRSDRAVAEAKALVTEATGDPFSSLLTSVVTWTLSVYYER